MAFGFLKKKKAVEEELELPPPPKPPEAMTFDSEIPPIRADDDDAEQPAFPEFKLDQEEPEEAELPEEELPEAPVKALDKKPSIIPPELKTPELPKPKVFDKTITEELSRETVIEKPEVKPLFVAVDDYKNVMSNTNVIRAKLLEAEEYIQRLADLKIEEEKAFARWKKQLESVEKKLTYVDAVITKAQG